MHGFASSFVCMFQCVCKHSNVLCTVHTESILYINIYLHIYIYIFIVFYRSHLFEYMLYIYILYLFTDKYLDELLVSEAFIVLFFPLRFYMNLLVLKAAVFTKTQGDFSCWLSRKIP